MKPFLLSVFDYTGAWAKPYAESGWRVLLWDYKVEGDILERFGWLCGMVEEENGGHIDGLLAAPPCTAFASSGARWWPEKDAAGSFEKPFDSFTDYMVTLTLLVFVMVERFQPKFWALENPVGRIEKLVPELKPYRRLAFDPCDFGDPYTKRTIIWGNFNPRLRKTPVNPDQGSKMHTLPRNSKRAELRSATPPGFARAFFEANRLRGKPATRRIEKKLNLLEAG